MGRYPVSELPEGYIIAFLQKKHYPMRLTIDDSGVPHAHGFKNRDGKVVSYSKRVYAAHFVEQHSSGRIDWAEVEVSSATGIVSTQ